MLVNSKIIVGPTDTFRLDWLIVYRNCKPYVADMIYEGTSMMTTKRDEVDAVVSRSGIDVLLEKLASIAKVQSSEVRTAEFAQVNFDTLILKAKENP